MREHPVSILCLMILVVGCCSNKTVGLMDEVKGIDWTKKFRTLDMLCPDADTGTDTEAEKAFILLLKSSLTSDERVLSYLKEQVTKRAAMYEPSYAIHQYAYSTFFIRDKTYPYDLVDVCALALTAKTIYLVEVKGFGMSDNPPKPQYVLEFVKAVVGSPPISQSFLCSAPGYTFGPLNGKYGVYLGVLPGGLAYYFEGKKKVLCPAYWPYSAIVELGIRMRKMK